VWALVLSGGAALPRRSRGAARERYSVITFP